MSILCFRTAAQRERKVQIHLRRLGFNVRRADRLLKHYALRSPHSYPLVLFSIRAISATIFSCTKGSDVEEASRAARLYFSEINE